MAKKSIPFDEDQFFQDKEDFLPPQKSVFDTYDPEDEFLEEDEIDYDYDREMDDDFYD